MRYSNARRSMCTFAFTSVRVLCLLSLEELVVASEPCLGWWPGLNLDPILLQEEFGFHSLVAPGSSSFPQVTHCQVACWNCSTSDLHHKLLHKKVLEGLWICFLRNYCILKEMSLFVVSLYSRGRNLYCAWGTGNGGRGREAWREYSLG